MKSTISRHPATAFVVLLLSLLFVSRYTDAEVPKESEDAAAVRAVLADLKALRWYEGLSKLRQVVRRHPNYADAYLYLGMIYTEMSQPEIALRYVRKAIALDPTKGAYHNQVGVILAKQGQYHDALQAFKKAEAGNLEKDREKAWRNIGSVLKELMQWEDAIQAYQTALQLQPRDPETHVALGRVYLDRNLVQEAIREFATAAELEPEWAEARALLGMAYSRAGRSAEAVEAFRMAIAIDPQNQLAHYNLAQVLTRLGRPEEAHKALQEFQKLRTVAQEREARGFVVGSTFQTATRKVQDERLEEAIELLWQVLILEPRFVPAHYVIGFAFLKQAKYEHAIASLRQAVDLDPLNAGAYFYLGGAYRMTGQLAQALEATQRAIVIYDENPEYHNQLGVIHLELDQREQARRAFEDALKLEGNFFLAQFNLGSLHLTEGNLEEALRSLSATVEVAPGHAEARRLLGLALLEDGQYDKGIEQYREAVRLSPGEERLYLALAEAFVRMRAYGEAEQVLTAAIQAIGRFALAHYNLGELYYIRGRYQEALREFQKVMELNGGVGLDRIYRKIGAIYVNQIKFEEAIEAYKKALEINPQLPEAHGALGDLYLQRNRYEDALAEYSAVLAIVPRKAHAHVQIGQVYLRMGRYEESIEASRNALGLEPEHRGARYTLASALLRLGKTEDGQKEMQGFQQMQAAAQDREHRQRELVALNQAALGHMQEDQYEEAIALLRKAAEHEPRRGLSHFRLGLALIKAERHAEAVEALQKAMDLAFDVPEIHRYLAEEYRLLGKLAESEREKTLYARMKHEQHRGKLGSR